MRGSEGKRSLTRCDRNEGRRLKAARDLGEI